MTREPSGIEIGYGDDASIYEEVEQRPLGPPVRGAAGHGPHDYPGSKDSIGLIIF